MLAAAAALSDSARPFIGIVILLTHLHIVFLLSPLPSLPMNTAHLLLKFISFILNASSAGTDAYVTKPFLLRTSIK